jgi:hypothetical protein
LSAGLPHAPVSWVTVQKQAHDVVISTYGRGLYILDDITPLEQMADKAAGSGGARLFAPRSTYRFTRGGRALINYELKSAPKDGVKIEILDAAGKVIREVRGLARAGLNRASWDMRVEPPRLIALRTTPPENPHIWEEPRFRGQDTRPVTHWGLAPAQVGPVVAPGKYSVRLTVDGQSQTQPLEIMKDPKVAATEADLEASVLLQLRIRDDISASADIVNQLEVMRKQLDDAQKGLRGQKGKEDLAKSMAAMEARMLDVEHMILEPASMLSDDKYFVQAYRVYMNLIWLNGEVGPGAGDVAGGADFRPTDTSVAVLATIEKDLDAAKAAYKKLMETELPAFNRTLAEKGVTPIV